MIKRLFCALGLAASVLSAPAGASTLAIQEMDADANVACNSGAGQTCGMEFTALTNMTITALGAFDLNSDGFADAVTPSGILVSLFDMGGNTLASATVTSADRLAGGSLPGAVSGDWRMVDLAVGLQLTAGTNYVVAAVGLVAPFGTLADTTLSTDIAFVAGRFSNGQMFPTSTRSAIFSSGNFEYTLTAVPVPASLLLLGTGVIGFGALGRRRRKTKTG